MTDSPSMQDIYVETLQDLYNAEAQIIKVLVQTVEAEAIPELKEALVARLQDTEHQSETLAQMVDKLKTGTHSEIQ